MKFKCLDRTRNRTIHTKMSHQLRAMMKRRAMMKPTAIGRGTK